MTSTARKKALKSLARIRSGGGSALDRTSEQNLVAFLAEQWTGSTTTCFGVSIGKNDGIHLAVTGGSSFRDAEHSAHCFELTREAILFIVCVRPDDWQEIEALLTASSDLRFRAASILPLFPHDIAKLIQTEANTSLVQVLDSKWWQRFGARMPWVKTDISLDFPGLVDEHILVSQTSQLLEEAKVEDRDWVVHPLVDRLYRRLESPTETIVYGSSGSGKSVLIAQVAQRLVAQGVPVCYLNLSRAPLSLQGLASFLKAEFVDKRKAIVVDDVQSNPAVARYLLEALQALQRSTSHCKGFTAVVWPEMLAEIQDVLEDAVIQFVAANAVSGDILKRYQGELPQNKLDEARAKCGSDLALLSLVLQIWSSSEKLGFHDVAEAFWTRRFGAFDLDSEADAMLVICTLGRYDIPAPDAFCIQVAGIQSTAIDSLLKSGVVRRNQGGLSVGHRSLAGLLADWLEAKGAWACFSERHAPVSGTELVLQYLKTLPPGDMVRSLRAIQGRSGFKEDEALSRRAAALVEVWSTFEALLRRVETQQQRDPTWGGSAAGAMFAVQVLSALGMSSAAEPSLGFLRSTRDLSEGTLVWETSRLREQHDFEAILIRMEREDAWETHWEAAHEIDVPKFRENWLAGVVLTSEGSASLPASDVRELVRWCEMSVLPGKGFYPPRVNWVTSRCLIGLGLCGVSVSSPTVRSVSDWLVRDRKEGGARSGGIWRSGTGTWNSDIEATAMALLALSAVGHEMASSSLDEARDFLLDSKEQWIEPSKELDGALALHAYLASGGSWEHVAEEARHLSRWALSDALWNKSSEAGEEATRQACHVAQIAYHLISVGWKAVASDLRSFLDTLQIPALYREELVSVKGADALRSVNVSEVEINNGLTSYLQELEEIRLESITVVGEYRKVDPSLRASLRTICERISSQLLEKTIGRTNYLIWAAPGSGKSFLIQELARSMGSNIEFCEVNLAREGPELRRRTIQRFASSSTASLCMFDEVDAHVEGEDVYDEIFSYFDLNVEGVPPRVVVAIGSGGSGQRAMVESIQKRSKGKDLVDRIPQENRFVIPPMTQIDSIGIFASQIAAASQRLSLEVDEVEKLALYFAATAEGLTSARQLSELALAAVQRIPRGERAVRFLHTCNGTRANAEFWVKHRIVAEKLGEQRIWIRR
jgi:hypothetical protein